MDFIDQYRGPQGCARVAAGARMNRFTRIAIIVALWILTLPAEADGIDWPRLGFPAVVAPGGLLELCVRGESAVSLEGAGQVIPLDVTWSPGPDTARTGRAVVPEGTAPGRYALRVVGTDATALSEGSIHVLDAFPEDYAIAIVRGVRSPDARGPLPVIPPDLGVRLKAESVQLAILLGPLTHGGTAEEYQALEALLLDSEVPVYLCPDVSDARSSLYGAYFGDRVHGVTFGRDGYLFLGAGLTAADPQSHARLGEAHRLRRALRASRWSVGVTSAYGLDWDLRSQIALFVDDPLNYLIAGAAPVALGATLPWGKTEFALPSAPATDSLIVLDVTATGIRLRPQPEAEGKTEAAASPAEDQVLSAE